MRDCNVAEEFYFHVFDKNVWQILVDEPKEWRLQLNRYHMLVQI